MSRNPPPHVMSAVDYYSVGLAWALTPEDKVSHNWQKCGIKILDKVNILPPSNYECFLSWLSLSKKIYVNNEHGWPEEYPGSIGGFFVLQEIGRACGPHATEREIIIGSTRVVARLWHEYQSYMKEINTNNAGVACEF